MLADGGACFLLWRMAEPLVTAGRLLRVADAPQHAHPAYMVFPRRIDDDVLPRALEGLRRLVRSPSAIAPSFAH
jgi:hypothetical protein